MSSKPQKTLDTFPNPQPQRDYRIHMEIPEFTCLCPKTGQPDFATIELDYIPDRKCVELKSLKLYMTARFYVRGGVFTTVVAETRKRGWRMAEKVDLDAIAGQPSIR